MEFSIPILQNIVWALADERPFNTNLYTKGIHREDGYEFQMYEPFEWHGRSTIFSVGSNGNVVLVAIETETKPDDNIELLEENGYNIVNDGHGFTIGDFNGPMAKEYLTEDYGENMDIAVEMTKWQIEEMENGISLAETPTGLPPDNVIQGPWGEAEANLFCQRRIVRANKIKLIRGIGK